MRVRGCVLDLLIIIWILCGIAASLIAPSRGRDPVGWFFLGLVLGLLGLLLIALLPALPKDRLAPGAPRAPSLAVQGAAPRRGNLRASFEDPPLVTPAAPIEPSYDWRKWQILKEVDPEIAAASARLQAPRPHVEDEFAEKFLALGDRSYLAALERSVTERAQASQGAPSLGPRRPILRADRGQRA